MADSRAVLKKTSKELTEEQKKAVTNNHRARLNKMSTLIVHSKEGGNYKILHGFKTDPELALFLLHRYYIQGMMSTLAFSTNVLFTNNQICT